jgi:hypothetical protein
MIAMKAIGFAALALLVGCSVGHAGQLGASVKTEVARFAAATLTDDQGARVVVSNVTVPPSDSNTACHVQVTFYGASGAVINTEEQALKAGATASIAAKASRGLLRATISTEAAVDASKPCDLISRLEVYDLHTGTTFVSIAPNLVNSSVELDVTSSIPGHKVINRRHRFRRTSRLFANQAALGMREEVNQTADSR